MSVINKIFRKFKIDFKFYTTQKFGVVKPDQYTIPKFNLVRLIPPDSIIIDCGAHVGSDSVELARMFPDSQVHGFEAVPSIYKRMVHNTRKYNNISCHNIALSDRTGTAEMYVSSGADDGSSSLLAPKEHLELHPDIVFNEKILVNAMSLDDWARQQGVERVDFLWLDMQGFEYRMLQASKEIFPKVRAIHTEVNVTESYENVGRYHDLKAWLAGQGFVEYKKALPAGSSQGNVLFVKKECLPNK